MSGVKIVGDGPSAHGPLPPPDLTPPPDLVDAVRADAPDVVDDVKPRDQTQGDTGTGIESLAAEAVVEAVPVDDGAVVDDAVPDDDGQGLSAGDTV